MNVKQINSLLSIGTLDKKGLFPHLEELERARYIFNFEFGLEELPHSPGLIIIRGARQYGKSTWLEKELKRSIQSSGCGTAYYLNGDEIGNVKNLITSIREILPLYAKGVQRKRLFIDEITAIKDWERGIKRLIDAGELKELLVVTTGSKATDLRRGAERFPGRKGKLSRSNYIFLPVSYGEFKRVCGEKLKENTLLSYLISGGSPPACSELAAQERLPEYIISTVKDWIYGECSASRRDRASLLGIMEVLFRSGGTPVGQAKLAREAGLANNTVAAGYIELLRDVLSVSPSYAWDASGRILRRRPYKIHFINLLTAVSWYPGNIRSVDDFKALSAKDQAPWYEWLVAQELWRRNAIKGEEFPDIMRYWKTPEHEIDFVLASTRFIEVKRGRSTPVEFSWFPLVFRKGHLTVINSQGFETGQIRGLTLEHWLEDC